jgi:CrcB protein
MNLLFTLGWVGLGGALGSIARTLIGMALPSRFPWATLLINVTGSLLIGWLVSRLGPGDTAASATMRNLLVAGFCGGYTTFSTFSWQTLEQMQEGRWGAAALNIILSVVLSLVAVWLGWRLGRA